ncbi:hypothetical protein ACFXGI_34620 [Streptomyces sp. NPDC059355]|uniref:hypothetical protein n=1 Tax=Streptomyces sp. NPDC059355 TaxID=3346811 RepID=UPI0036CD1B5A
MTFTQVEGVNVRPMHKIDIRVYSPLNATSRVYGMLVARNGRERAARMGTWPEELDAARDWKGYRRALCTLRTAGPVFKDLPGLSYDIATKNPHLRGYSSPATFSGLLDRRLPDTRPDWLKVELVVRICLAHQGYENASVIVADWAVAYRRCGGDPGSRFPTPAAIPAPKPGPELPLPELDGDPVPVPVPVPERKWWKWWERKPVRAGVAVVLAAGMAFGAVETADSLRRGTLLGASKEPSPPQQSADRAASSSPKAQPEPGKSPNETPTGKTPSLPPVIPEDTRSQNQGNSDGHGDPGQPVSVSSPTPSVQPKPVQAVVKWSDDGPNSTDDSSKVWAYDSTTTGGAEHHNGSYVLGESLVVQCQITGGRQFQLGDAYKGPDPRRSGVWYRVQPGKWVPAVYIDAGSGPLPAC